MDEFVSSLAEKMKKIGMETEVDDKEVNDNATDLVAMPKMDILRTD